jgi:two-component system sensor histidine kinase KdpD
LEDRNKLSEENKYNLVSEIAIASLRLNQQVENLLNMSRVESGYIELKRDWVDVNELVYSVVNRLEDKLKYHQLKVEINEKLPLFKLDFGIIEPVLYNLISNAILYTEPNSVITMSADSTLELKGHFDENLNSQRDNIKNCLLLEISDNGLGFPPDEIKNVFNKFYRLKNSRAGGTGLGLSIAKGFVEAHNGVIHLSNLPKGGARFSIRIPAETSYFKQSEK